MSGYICKTIQRLICRIGSLEICGPLRCIADSLICRIGSLEIGLIDHAKSPLLICRIGSLEKRPNLCKARSSPYLPHRQLRNERVWPDVRGRAYLPHRQLRKAYEGRIGDKASYLPHRQLRKDQPSHACHASPLSAA